MKRFLIISILLFNITVNQKAICDEFIWPDMDEATKPWTRWWWLGNAVDTTNIKWNLDQIDAAGIGGVEITSVYGVKGYEDLFIPYLSEEYADILEFTANYAHKLGLGVDIPPGSGWRCGGLGLDIADADAIISIEKENVHFNQVFRKTYENVKPQAILAVSDKGERLLLGMYNDKKKEIVWKAPEGSWTIYTVTQKWSGAKVKRPAPGGDGYSFNPYSLRSFKNMTKPFEKFFKKFPSKLIRAQFHDSFEYTGNWTDDFFVEFSRRRGYDLRLYIPELSGEGEDDKIKRIKCDYRETISDLVLDHFIIPWVQWCHYYGQKARNQSHGSPANLLDLYGYVDIPETEIFGTDQTLNGVKFASSAANVMGNPLISSESFTWLDEHFTVSLFKMKNAVDQLFLGGVNHIFFHGTSYSPKDVKWPGWVFYASTQVNPRNTLWKNLPAFNQYITRCQSVLQKGKSDNDILIYWPVFDFWMNAKGFNKKLSIHHNDWIQENSAGLLSEQLLKSGYTYDFISDRQINISNSHNGHIKTPGGQYKLLVIPECEHMPLSTMSALLDMAKQGGTIVFQKDVPHDIPGFAQLELKKKQLDQLQNELEWKKKNNYQFVNIGQGKFIIAQDLIKVLSSLDITRENIGENDGLSYIRRQDGENKYYFILNRKNKQFDGWIHLVTDYQSVVLMDPMSGKTGLADIKGNTYGNKRLRLQLSPGQSMILKCVNRKITGEKWFYLNPTGKKSRIKGEWNISFVDGGPVLPVPQKMNRLVSWTKLADKETQRFAGTASYQINFDVPDVSKSYLLDLGKVAESAVVYLNEEKMGCLFTPPYQLPISGLRPTGNKLLIKVTNLAANRIRDMDIRKDPWRIFYDINFVNIDYKKFDASGWPVADSGLLGPVTINRLD